MNNAWEMQVGNANYSAEVFLERIKSLLARDHELIGEATQRTCIYRNYKGDFEHALSVITFSPSREKSSHVVAPLNYGSLVLTTDRLNHAQFLDRVDQLSKKRFRGGNFDFETTSIGFHDTYEPSNNDFYDWPCRAFNVSFGSVQISHEPLLHPTLPSYESSFDAIKEFFQFKKFNGSSDSRLGRVLICLPNFNARIGKITLDKGTFTVNVESGRKAQPKLKLDVSYSSGEESSRVTQPMKGSKAQVPLAFKPDSLMLWLISKRGYLADFHEENQHYSRGAQAVLPKRESVALNSIVNVPSSALMSFAPTTITTGLKLTSPIPSRDVFVVHGRNSGTKDKVARFLAKLQLNPIILHEQPSKGNTIIEKFELNSDVAFAVVLLTADDEGRLRGRTQLKSRARQNVLFEFGFFIGKLGRNCVCALLEKDVEVPSDYDGVVYIALDAEERWKMDLVRELRASGVDVDANLAL